MARASLAVQTQRVNMAIGMLQRKQPFDTILAALMQRGGVSRRQAYRYLLQAQNNLEPRPVPEPKAVFTVNLPRSLIQELRTRCRRERRPLSHLVAQVLQQWLDQHPAHGRP